MSKYIVCPHVKKDTKYFLMRSNRRRQETKYRICNIITAVIFLTSIGLSSYAEKEIVLGALLPITGDLSSSGEAAKAAIDLAEKDINEYLADTGFDVRVRLIVEDTETKPEIALMKLEELEEEGVRVIIGPGSSASVNQIKSYAEKKGILLISHSSTAPSMAIPEDNVFRFVLDDRSQAEAIARLMWDDGCKAVIPIWRDDVWGNDLMEATKKNFEDLGGTIVNGVGYTPTTANFSAKLEFINSKVSQALAQYNSNSVAVHLMAFKEVEHIFTQAEKYPILSTVRWYGSDGTAINEVLTSNKKAARFATRTDFSNPILGGTMTGKFELVKEEIREKIKREPNIYSLVAYDAVWIATKACIATRGNSIDALMEVVRQEAKQYTGITGWMFLNEEGDRKFGNYDFWNVMEENGNFLWKRVAIYRIDPILPGKVIHISE